MTIHTRIQGAHFISAEDHAEALARAGRHAINMAYVGLLLGSVFGVSTTLCVLRLVEVL